MGRAIALVTVAAAAVLSGQGPALAGPPQIVLEVSDATVYEGNAGETLASFEIRRIGAHTGKAITVSWSTFDGSAVGASDYAPSGGALVFDTQRTVYTVTVPVTGDLAQEPDEYFLVRVDRSGGGDGEGRGTILNDDGWPADNG